MKGRGPVFRIAASIRNFGVVGLSCAAFSGSPALSAQDGQIRRFNNHASYPAACFSNAAGKKRVTVAYSPTRDRRAKNVRVLVSEDPCLNEAAVAITRTDVFLPVNKNSRVDLEATYSHILTFDPAGQGSPDRDVSPLVRTPPTYPERCFRAAAPIEIVIVEFDVSIEGSTENARVIDTTNKCFDQSAVASVKPWRYELSSAANTAALKGVQTVVTYELSDGGPARDIRRQFTEQSRSLDKRLGGDPAEAQALLADIASLESEFGDGMTPHEASIFYRLRGAARVDAKDYLRARDDLVYSLRAGHFGLSWEPIVKAIETFEKLVPDLPKQAVSADSPVRIGDESATPSQ